MMGTAARHSGEVWTESPRRLCRAHAPLDWPDCCALCSDTNINDTTAAACAGWSFHPNTGSCQLMFDVSLAYNVSTSRTINGAVNGYPSYFEPPVTGCWSRTEFDLCNNMNLGLLILGDMLGCVCVYGFVGPLGNSDLHKELVRVRRSTRLLKAAYVQISTTQ